MTPRERRKDRRTRRKSSKILLGVGVVFSLIAIGVLSFGIWVLNVAAEAPPELDLISVGSEYTAAGGKARIRMTVNAHVDLPDPLGNPYVEVPVQTELSVTPEHRLAIDVWLPDLRALGRSLIAWATAMLSRLLGPLWGFLGAWIDSKIEDY